MATTHLGIPLPQQTTSPPDVAGWLAQGFDEVDTILGTGSKVITVAEGTAAGQPLRRDAVLYGAAASCPASLPIGTLYCGY